MPSRAGADGVRPRLFHPAGRRLAGRLCVAQWRRRLAGRPGGGGGKPRPHGAGSRRRAGPSPRALSDPFGRRAGRFGALGASGRAATGSSRATPGLALGVTGADCGMLLFADPRAGVIGAAHAGWKGALTGMVEAPSPPWKVGRDARPRYRGAWGRPSRSRAMKSARSFTSASRRGGLARQGSSRHRRGAGHFMFDLPGFIEMRGGARRSARSRTRARHLRRAGALLFLSPHGAQGEPDTAGWSRRSRRSAKTEFEINRSYGEAIDVDDEREPDRRDFDRGIHGADETYAGGLAKAMGVQREHVNELRRNDRRRVTRPPRSILARVFGNSAERPGQRAATGRSSGTPCTRRAPARLTPAR